MDLIYWPEADTKVQRLPKEGLWKLFVDLGCASLKIGQLLGKVLVTVIFLRDGSLCVR